MRRTQQEMALDILDSVDEYISSFDKDWAILYISKKTAADFGTDPQSLIGKNFWQAFPRFLGTVLEKKYRETMETRQTQTFEWKTIYTPVISIREFTVFPSKDGITVIGKDITERKKAEIAVAESKSWLESVITSMNDPVLIYDSYGNIRGCNDAYIQFYNFNSNDIPKAIAAFKKLLNAYYLNGEILPLDRWPSSKALRGESGSEELIIERTDTGEKRFVNYSYAPVKGADSQIVGAVLVLKDVTERKKSEEALKRFNEELEKRVNQRTAELACERERLFNILENLPVMVCLIAPDYHIPFANRLFKKTFGESMGRSCYDYIACQNAPCAFCESLRPLETGKTHHWEANFPNGIVVDAWDYPFTDIDGSRMVLEVNIDITERKKLEKQVKDSERLAAIGTTAGMVGHDIRNPLQAIMSDTYLIKDELTSVPECKNKEGIAESISSIENNIYYINKIVLDLQDFARPIRPEFSIINLSDIIEKVFATVPVPDHIKLFISVRGIERVRTDAMLVQRVLTNLVTNAIQAMPEGGSLKISAVRRGEQVEISVSDSGIGIPDEVKPKLFEPMMTTKSKGQGFGLAVSKRLVEALDGNISFESEAGKGTKFTINLPFAGAM